MYEQFYGLSRTPFAVTPDPAMLFMSRVHREALATIIYGVETRKGFIVCTGEVGTGKSTIIRAFFDQAAADPVKLLYIFTPQVTPFEMARFICRELGLEDPESIFAAVPQLQLTLLDIFEGGGTVVLMIDEAQLLPAETLEFLRLLSNFETDTEKLIQIVLVGQPEVDTMLARQDMRQVNQRVALRARLGAFGVEETYHYMEHRLRIAGADGLAQVMSPSAAWLIAEAAGGIPRRINILADNALIAGFGAAQRPLGSRLAGIAIGEFLAKSGAADPRARDVTTSSPFAAGWRMARKLRSALAREKGEPAAFITAAPVPAPPAALRLVTPTALSPAARPAVRPATPPVDPLRLPPPVAADPPATGDGTAASGAAAAIAPAAPAGAEPPAVPLVSAAAAVEPAAKADVTSVAPVMPPAVQGGAAAEEGREWIGYEPVAPPPLPAPIRVPANGSAVPYRAGARSAMAWNRAPAGTQQWPALSRIRDGLQAAPRRERHRGSVTNC